MRCVKYDMRYSGVAVYIAVLAKAASPWRSVGKLEREGGIWQIPYAHDHDFAK